jgi:uncharacterized protein
MKISRVLQYLVPKEKKFYPLFEEGADYIVKAAVLLNKLLLIDDENEKAIIMRTIKEIEEKGDHVAHTIYEELNRTFITPFDREDIQKLASSMDDVLDYINSCTTKIKLYKPKEISKYSIEISELIVQASREIETGIKELNNLKMPHKIKDACIRINDIENQADDIYHQAISDFFETEKDAIELIKKNDIILTLEKATDKAEDVSDVLKSIIVKIA